MTTITLKDHARHRHNITIMIMLHWALRLLASKHVFERLDLVPFTPAPSHPELTGENMCNCCIRVVCICWNRHSDNTRIQMQVAMVMMVVMNVRIMALPNHCAGKTGTMIRIHNKQIIMHSMQYMLHSYYIHCTRPMCCRRRHRQDHIQQNEPTNQANNNNLMSNP